ncbi:hypothetical protein [Propionicicella superfundia]|uniref:hypothetical protein n=1 Tax=Propionicicella superfundia TaxID=348582 RepID=UPI0003F4CCF1|nr:hypothetical protein [Propionicicella superfundia]
MTGTGSSRTPEDAAGVPRGCADHDRAPDASTGSVPEAPADAPLGARGPFAGLMPFGPAADAPVCGPAGCDPDPRPPTQR